MSNLSVRFEVAELPSLLLQRVDVQVIEPPHVAHGFIEASEQDDVVAPHDHAMTGSSFEDI
jgi:hypothetical protein